MAAAQGASLKELMERMGHSSPRAALIYQHATRERDQKIAAGMGRLISPLLAHGWPSRRLVSGSTQGAAEQCQVCLDAPLAHLGWLHSKTLCLQGAFTLSATVACLGFTLFSVRPCQLVSGLVVVRRGGQPGAWLHSRSPNCATTSTARGPTD
jgi:hypothetical protein